MGYQMSIGVLNMNRLNWLPTSSSSTRRRVCVPLLQQLVYGIRSGTHNTISSCADPNIANCTGLFLQCSLSNLLLNQVSRRSGTTRIHLVIWMISGTADVDMAGPREAREESHTVEDWQWPGELVGRKWTRVQVWHCLLTGFDRAQSENRIIAVVPSEADEKSTRLFSLGISWTNAFPRTFDSYWLFATHKTSNSPY